MREDALLYIHCPVCHAANFDVFTDKRNEVEIRVGALTCSNCHRRYEIHKGILDLLPDPDPTIQSEQKGWTEMLGETSEALVETMLKLPYYEDAIWHTTAENHDQIMAQVDLTGKRVLDIGAGRCWSTRRMVLAGASYAMALDILLTRFIGLETADIFLQHDKIYFDRVVGNMNDLPVQAETFDIVFMTGTLHHSSAPEQCLREIARALVPGGIAIIINEPIRSLFRSKRLAGCPEIEHGINENIYTLIQYLQTVRGAGLKSQLFFPRSISKGLEQRSSTTQQEMGTIGHFVASFLWQRPFGRRLMQGSLLPVIGLLASMPLVMLAQKPALDQGQ